MVGKTSIINRFIKGRFIQSNKRTINTKAFQKNIDVDGNKFNLNIWDTAGEEKYHAVTPIFYQNSDGAIVVYDSTDRETYERAVKWICELIEILGDNKYRIILVGNKIDLPEKKVSSEEGIKLAKKYNANFLEVSAFNGIGIENIFETLISDIYQSKLIERQNLEIEEGNINKTKNKKKLIIIGGNERYEKRINDDKSCVC